MMKTLNSSLLDQCWQAFGQREGESESEGSDENIAQADVGRLLKKGKVKVKAR